MKAIASILCIYLFGLCVQPALFAFHPKKAKVMSCCRKKDKGKVHKNECGENGADDDCCGGMQCNPFFTQCPICAATGITTTRYQIPDNGFVTLTRTAYFAFDQFMISRYQADILHPPQFV